MTPVIWIICCVIIIGASYVGILPDSIIGALAISLAIGSISLFIGDRIPVWKTYFGGGVLLTMFVGSSATYFGWLPQSTLDTVVSFIGPSDFLNLFIIILIVGSIMSVDRQMLIKSISRFIPCIIAACIGAGVLAVLCGLPFGRSPSYVIAYYVLPIMSGGSGAGAIPLAQIFETVTGTSFDEYISIGMAMLNVGDLFAIIVASILGKVVSGKDKLSGDGQLVRQKEGDGVLSEEVKVPTLDDLGGALMAVLAIYLLASFTSNFILPSIAGASIHMLAYAIIYTVILKVFNLLPENMLAALIYTQKYFVSVMVIVIMFCCGLAYTDLGVMIAAMTDPVNLLICMAVVVGATLGGGLFGHFVGFYPYEAAVTSGLCMANAGGAGDVAVLSACKRMNLLPYAQISSRIGNAIILIAASFIFAGFF